MNRCFIAASISESASAKVAGKWIMGDFVFPSLGSGEEHCCWLNIHGMTMIMYLLVDFDQVLAEMQTLEADCLEVQFALALKCKQQKLLLKDVLSTVSRSMSFGLNQLKQREKLSFKKRALLIQVEEYRLSEALDFQAVDNPDAFFRLCAELHFWKGDEVVKKSKPLFLSPVFRLSSSYAIVDCYSTKAAFPNAPKSLANFLYQRKPWWYWPDVEGSEKPISVAQQQSKDLQELTTSFTEGLELSLEDSDPVICRDRNVLLRVKASSSKFERLLYHQLARDSSESELTPEMRRIAPILCPSGAPKQFPDDGLVLTLLSSTGLQGMKELAEAVEVVVVDEKGQSLSDGVLYMPESASFWIPSNVWPFMVPSFLFRHQSSEISAPSEMSEEEKEDNEISLIVRLRVKASVSISSASFLHRLEFVPYFQVRWTNADGQVMYSDSPPNRCVKVKFDYSPCRPSSTSSSGNQALARCAIPKKKEEEEEAAGLKRAGEMARNILEAPALRKKVEDLEQRLSSASASAPVSAAPTVLPTVVPTAVPAPSSVNTLVSVKADLNEWIRADSVVSRQSKCVKLLTTICHSVVDELKSSESWTSSFASVSASSSNSGHSPPSANLIVPLPFRKRQRTCPDQQVWRQAKDVFSAWLQACLRHIHVLAQDDVEGLRLFLKQSVGNNQYNQAYNASLEKCREVGFSRFSDLCRKLKECIDSKSLLFR